MERLDRIFVNNEWIDLFPKAVVIHLPKTHSDHNLLLLNLQPRHANSMDKPFRLETIWCRHPDFINLVKKIGLIRTLWRLRKILPMIF